LAHTYTSLHYHIVFSAISYTSLLDAQFGAADQLGRRSRPGRPDNGELQLPEIQKGDIVKSCG